VKGHGRLTQQQGLLDKLQGVEQGKH